MKPRNVAALAAIALILAACGSGTSADDELEPTSTTEHSHMHDDEGETAPWDGAEIPQVDVEVTGDPESGWDITADITGMEFSDPTTTEHVAGQGHTHVYVDGDLVTMAYEPVVHIDDLEPGTHQAMVTLARNDHTDYSLDGELIMGMTTFTVAGEVADADTTLMLMFMGGEFSGVDDKVTVSLGDLVEITVQSDAANELHVHGYDLFLDLQPGQPSKLRFTADVPGIFEVELEDGGILAFELEVS